MTAVRQMIRILAAVFILENIRCHDIYSDQDILRLQQIAAHDGHAEAVPSYSASLIQGDSNTYSSNKVDTQYHSEEENKGDDYSRADRGRNRKVYRIKNPFQQQSNENEKHLEHQLDTETSASSQYGAVQYSLPPEEFLAQLRAQNQYQTQQQLSSQPSASSYTATPQPQYQYSTVSTSDYNNNQQSNYVSRTESRAYNSNYETNGNVYQYNNNFNPYNQDTVQSTPTPPYLSTVLPNNQYLGTPANTYVSSPASSSYLSSPQSLQQFVSSPISVLQPGSNSYNNNVGTTTAGNNPIVYQNNNDINKRMQIDHYDNSANGIRYPHNAQNLYHNEFFSSTIAPSTSSYLESKQETWQNSDLNSLAKSIQDSQEHYQNSRYNMNIHDNKHDSVPSNINSDTHRIGSMQEANNLYFNFVKPDHEVLNGYRDRLRNSQQETSQGDTYSHGDYGWKLSEKKSTFVPETSTSANNYRYQIQSVQPDTGAFSQVNFQIDTGKEYKYDQSLKTVPEKLDAEEFAKAAAKAHENYKQQLKAASYASNSQYNNLFANYPLSTTYYNTPNKLKPAYGDNAGHTMYSTIQTDLLSSSPLFYTSSHENIFENKQKLPFDHDKALKNIVPIDVSNVVQSNDAQIKISGASDSINKINIPSYNREQNDMNQYSTPSSDVYYKDKNYVYLNLKPKSEELSTPDRYKQLDSIAPFYGKQQGYDSFFNYGGYNSGNTRFTEETTQRNINYNQFSNNHHDVQSSANVPQQNLQRPSMTSDMNTILKLNDIPHRFHEMISADSFRLNSNNFNPGSIPNSLPLRINQNVDSHHLDVATDILSKLIASKTVNVNRPDNESKNGNLLSTINGFKVANPYNMDLKLVAEMLKEKSVGDEGQMSHLRDQYTKLLPMKFDVSQLQQLINLKNENSMVPLSNAIGGLTNPYFDIYSGGRPYQGVKYSRSEEEAENIPIADSSNNHPIGAVVEEDENASISEDQEIMDSQNDSNTPKPDSERSKSMFETTPRGSDSRQKHSNSLLPNRHPYKRKYPKVDIDEPYPLLKPPPPLSRHRDSHSKLDKNRRRNRPKFLRIFKTEPLFESSISISEIEEFTQPESRNSFSLAETRSDLVNEDT